MAASTSTVPFSGLSCTSKPTFTRIGKLTCLQVGTGMVMILITRIVAFKCARLACGFSHQDSRWQARDRRRTSERTGRSMPTMRANLPIRLFGRRVVQGDRLAEESRDGYAGRVTITITTSWTRLNSFGAPESIVNTGYL